MAFEKKEIDRREMLMILGKIYAITGGRYGRIGLCRFIQKEGGETIRRRYTFLSRAMLRIGMVIPDEGKGVAVRYKWNLAKFGPPSLALAERMIFETEDQLRISARERYRAHVERIKREENSRDVEAVEER